MKIGILVAMEEEIKHLIEELESYKIHKVANQIFYEGFIGEKAVCIVQSGIGKVNASIATTLLIERFKVNLIVNTGSSGAVKDGINVGDLVVSEKLAYHDVDNRVFEYDYGQIPQMPKFYEGDQILNDRIKEIAANEKRKIHQGLIVSGDSFVSSYNQVDSIKKYFPTALATEMEGAAVAQTCYQFDIPCLVIRSVSDSANEEAEIDFDDFVVLAGERSAQLVLSLINNIN